MRLSLARPRQRRSPAAAAAGDAADEGSDQERDGACRTAELMAAKPAKKVDKPVRKIAADNRKARFNYEIGEVFEAGVALTGSEVKSLRAGKATIGESYADARDGEIWLVNSNI